MKIKLSILRPLFMLPGMISLTLKRQRHNLNLTLLALLGIILAVGLVTNASFFSQAVDRVILLQELDRFSRITKRPPFSTSAYIFPSRRSPLTMEDAERVSHHIAGTLSGEVGLPLRHLGLQVSSGSMMLRPGPESRLYTEDQEYLSDVEVVYVADVAEHMDIVEGPPLDEDGRSSDVLDVWMHDRLVQKMGVQVGESLNIGLNLASNTIPIRLAGFWHAKDPENDFWFKDPDSALDSALLVRRQDYIDIIQPLIPSRTREANWYVILDGSGIIPKDSAAYLEGFQRALNIINKYLPGARLNTPPLDPLEDFVQRSATLTILLLSFNLPAFGILLYFLILTSAIIAQWQRKETSLLVSRGMSASDVLNQTLLEQLLLLVIGLPLGIAFGMLIARVMGYTTSFLSFTQRAPLPVSLQGLNSLLIVLALAVSLLARVWPIPRAARQSIVSEEQERARPSRAPVWHRYYLDLILVLPTAYAYRQLAQRGSLAGLIVDRPEDLYRDPLLILVPALFVLTASLLTMRLFPLVMRVIDALSSLTPWLAPHLALRQLGRQSSDYVKPLLLVIVSLAMGVYTLSMAASLDQWLIDRMYYRAGADLTFTPIPPSQNSDSSAPTEDADLETVGGGWIPLPTDFDEIDGVGSATRVGNFSARVNLATGDEIRGRFLALDRLDFPLVAWFRPDFAHEPLGGLMNQLATSQDGILVSEGFLASTGHRIGDQIRVLVGISSVVGIRTTFTIAGTYDYFPTVYEEETVTLIGNMEYLSSLLGITVPHDIWLKLEPGTDGEAILKKISSALSIDFERERDPQALIAEEQAKMERVGIFGTLTVGFIAATAMAVLGLLIYSHASLQERVYRFAVLHAVGLSRGQIVAQVIMEYTFLAMFGAVMGVLVGMLASELFIPFLRFTGEEGVPLPPLLPIIARDAVRNLALGFSLIIVFAEVSTITSTLYRRVIGMLKRPWI